MNNSKSSVTTGLVTILAGVVLLISSNEMTSKGIIILAGILFIAAGILNIILTLSSRNDDGTRRVGTIRLILTITVSAAAAVFGLSMLWWTTTFTSLIPLVFAVMLLIAAVIQFYVLAIGTRPLKLPGWFYALPAAQVVCAIVVYCQAAGAGDKVIMVTSGVSLIIFGVTSFLIGYGVAAAKRHLHNQLYDMQSSQPAERQIKDVDHKEIKSLD